MYASTILEHLKQNGQQADWEIAEAMEIPLPYVRSSLAHLSDCGQIAHCELIKFSNGKQIKGIFCRPIGATVSYSPAAKKKKH